jgi:hypothetical protein
VKGMPTKENNVLLIKILQQLKDIQWNSTERCCHCMSGIGKRQNKTIRSSEQILLQICILQHHGKKKKTGLK